MNYCCHERVWSPDDGFQWSTYRIPSLTVDGYELRMPQGQRYYTRRMDSATTLYAHRATEPCPAAWLPPQQPEYLNGRRVA